MPLQTVGNVNRAVKELLVAQKLNSGQKLTDEELSLYAIMSQPKKKDTGSKSDKRNQKP